MRNVGLSHRGRRVLGAVLGVMALAAVIAPSAQAAGPQFKPAMLDVTGWKMAGSTAGVRLAGVPLPSSGDGIGPGSYLLIDQTDGNSYICTANFVWNGPDGPYLGAAGHCFLPGNVSSSPKTNPGQYVTSVRVCVSGCAFGGQLGTIQGTFQTLGAVVFAQQSVGVIDVGNDFGLVRIDPTNGPIRTRVPVWGGPTTSGPRTPTLGDPVCLYGNAGGLGEVWATKARFGVGGLASQDGKAWYATMPSAPGDSGSAVVNCPGLTGTKAAGILTHLATNGTGIIAGTTVNRAIEMVKTGTSNNLDISVSP